MLTDAADAGVDGAWISIVAIAVALAAAGDRVEAAASIDARRVTARRARAIGRGAALPADAAAVVRPVRADAGALLADLAAVARSARAAAAIVAARFAAALRRAAAADALAGPAGFVIPTTVVALPTMRRVGLEIDADMLVMLDPT